jgi:enoyl-CoA hydratase/carnithine racemase
MAIVSNLRPHPTLASKFSTLQVQILENVVIVSLNSPERRNAINKKMWKEIGMIFKEVGTLGDDGRVVILKGSGHSAFTAGIDLTDTSLFPKSFEEGDEDPARRGISFASQIREMQAAFTAVEECSIPVIAAIDGYCIGAGIDLVSACDIRICSPTAKFSVREVRIGLAADCGTLQRLPKITGNDSLVRELCFTGEVFDADVARQIGFVSRVTPKLMEDVWLLAKKISQMSPVAVTSTKKSLVYSRDHSVGDGLDQIATHNALALMTHDVPAAVISAKKNTLPDFEPIPKMSRL